MVKYKVNLKFKENGKSLNETITEVLKIRLNKKINETCFFFKGVAIQTYSLFSNGRE